MKCFGKWYKKLSKPEWVYTKQRFSDFIFSCETKLSGDPNSGIYFRANPIPFTTRRSKVSYEAASGYEFDVAPDKSCGSIGDWYARPSFRIFADTSIIEQVYQKGDWNRMTLRARGNRLEYWINGTKVMDYKDLNLNGSRDGFIGLQVHDKKVMKAEFRNAYIIPIR